MKQIQILFLFLIICLSVTAQNTGNDAASIRAQMSEIRKKTNWSDAAAAKEANAKIQELSAKLTSAIRQSNPPKQQPGSEDLKPEEAAKIQQDNDDYSNKLWNQMMKIVQEGGKWDLAEPLREEIVEEYKEDENPAIKNNEWLESIPTLVLNLSWPQIQLIIDQMPMFKGIKTLIVTCDTKGTPVDLEKILKNAEDYPLEELYIINFGSSVSILPDRIGNYSKLLHIGLFNDNLDQLPSTFSRLTGLQALYLDMNPINSIIGKISPMKKLTELGLAKTQISADEISKISKLLPTCKILSE
jgi:hypothetical protein